MIGMINAMRLMNLIILKKVKNVNHRPIEDCLLTAFVSVRDRDTAQFTDLSADRSFVDMQRVVQ